MDPVSSVLGVKVYLQGEASTHRYQSESDASGFFSFSDIPEGRYQIFAIQEDRAAPVQTISRLGLGPFVGVELLMQEAHAVEGRVVESGGSKLGLAAEVRLRHVEGGEAERRTRSSSDGSFVIRGVLPGRWIAEARAPGYLPSPAQSFAAEARRSLEISMDGGASVAGVVVGPNNIPVPGAVVVLKGSVQDGTARTYSQIDAAPAELSQLAPGQRLLPKGELGVLLGPIPMPPPPGGFEIRVASLVVADEEEQSELPIATTQSNFVTDERGRFRISGVEAGDYRLLVSHELWADLGTPSFRVRHGQALSGRRVRLQAGTRLGGKVSDDRGLPVAGASVIVNFADGREPALTVSDEEGGFSFAPMTGRVEVVVEALAHARATQSHRLAVGSLTAVDKRIEFRLARANAYIEGRLVDRTGFSIRDAEIRLEPGPGVLPTRNQRSDENGLFRLEGLPKGTHWLLISHPDYPVHRASSKTGVQGDLVVPFGAGLALELRDSSTQSPIAMASIELELPATSARPGVARAWSDESGKASFLPIRAGSYELRVDKEGYAALSRPLALTAGQRIGEVTQRLVLEMVRGATIAGILRDGRGERVVGASIRVGQTSGQSDKDGRFRLLDVPSGTIQLQIEHQGKVSEQELTLQAGEERVTLELVHAPGQAEDPEAAGAPDSPETTTDAGPE
jgi:hypothetical protein